MSLFYRALVVLSIALTLVSGSAQHHQVALSHHASKKVPASYYSSLVVFGASYNDNGHARPARYQNTLRKYWPFVGGRYSNGKVAVEYLTGMLPHKSTIQLLDYAYGGSHIDNALTGGSAPSAKNQANEYLTSVNRMGSKPGRVLHVYNSGINSITVIWTDAIAAKLTASAKKAARAQVSMNVAAAVKQLRSIARSKEVGSKWRGGRDVLVVGLPPLEIVPTFKYQHGDKASLEFLKVLSNQFSDELKAAAKQLQKEVKDGKVMWYDMRELWYDAYARPGSYGLSANPITKTCFDSSTNKLCKKPSEYLYLDTLHPTTSFHKVWADKMAGVVRKTI